MEIGGGRSGARPMDGCMRCDDNVMMLLVRSFCVWVFGHGGCTGVCLGIISFRSRGVYFRAGSRAGPGNVNKKGSAPRHCQPFPELLAIFIYIFTYLHM